jgi:hypothetical protein
MKVFAKPVFIAIGLCLFSFLSCEKTGESLRSECGDSYIWETDVSSNFINSESQGDYVSLYYEDLTEPVAICTRKYVQINFDVICPDKKNKAPTLNLNGRAYAALTLRKITNLNNDTNFDHYQGNEIIDLEPYFNGNISGYINLQIVAVFETKSRNIDSLRAVVADACTKMSIKLNYDSVK